MRAISAICTVSTFCDENVRVSGWRCLAGGRESFECVVDFRDKIPGEDIRTLYASGNLKLFSDKGVD